MLWQPIETAPKDGTEILGFGKCLYEDEGYIPSKPRREIISFPQMHSKFPGFDWLISDGSQGNTYGWMKPTHWQPLPEPPEDS